MIQGRTIVVDIGKTNAKASLWDSQGELLTRNVRSNQPQKSPLGYSALDVEGIEAWLIETISDFAGQGDVARIVPVGHGAAAALIRDDELLVDPMDYEQEIGEDCRADYDSGRDPFSATGSPALPQGLNLGIQLHLIEDLLGPLPDKVVILPWPQYWAWRFCGVASSEVTSLGCHTDLWRPAEKTFSELALRRGWAERMAPLRSAGDVLGPITRELAAATGLNPDCQVLTGLHDSNAALLAARGLREIADNEATVLSTGTWFVAMRSAGKDVEVDISELAESCDCLVNVDVHGRPTPSARFMGGREAELAGGVESFRLTDTCEDDELLGRLAGLIDRDVCAYPGFVPGVGPFPDTAGSWVEKPDDPVDLRAATDLYLALVADTSLGLIGSKDRLLIEGRFAEDIVFTRALAALRPDQTVFTSNAEHDLTFGALRLVAPDLSSTAALEVVEPLDLDIAAYAGEWRERANKALGAS